MAKKHNENLKENLETDNEEVYNESELENIIEDTNVEVLQNEYKEALQRLQAEFENYRKRNESLVEKSKLDGVVFAISKLLPVLDSFKSAKQLVKNQEFLNSLNLIEKQFYTGLENLHISKIEAEGKQFNPNFHNAVLTGCDNTKPDDEILEVFQDGFIMNDKVIRHSVVKINKIN